MGWGGSGLPGTGDDAKRKSELDREKYDNSKGKSDEEIREELRYEPPVWPPGND